MRRRFDAILKLERERLAELSEEELIQEVEKDAAKLGLINQTETICLHAARIHENALLYVNKQTPAICEAAINNNPEQIHRVKPQYLTSDMCWSAVTYNPRLIRWVPYEFQSQAMVNMAIEHSCRLIEYIDFKYVSKEKLLKYILANRAPKYGSPINISEGRHYAAIKYYLAQWPEDITDLANNFELCVKVLSVFPELAYKVNGLTAEHLENAVKNSKSLINCITDYKLFEKLIMQDLSLLEELTELDQIKCTIIYSLDPNLLVRVKGLRYICNCQYNFCLNKPDQAICHEYNVETKNNVLILAGINPHLLAFVDRQFFDYDLMLSLISCDPKYVSVFSERMDCEQLENVMRQYPFALEQIVESRQTQNICKAALETDPRVIVHVKNTSLRQRLIKEYPLKARKKRAN